MARAQDVRKVRDKARGKPPRKKRKNNSIPEHIRKAERNQRVAVHRARRAGKTEDEAQEAGQAAYKRAIARYMKEQGIDSEEIEAEAEEHTKKAGKNRTSNSEERYEEKCGAIRTNNGIALVDEDGNQIYCQHRAGWGTDHPGYGRCKYHSGNAPNSKIAAQREKVAEDMIRAEIAFYGEARDIDAAQALSEEVKRTAGHVAWLASQVQDLNDGELTQFTAQGPKANIVIQMYQDERDRLVNVSKVALAAGVAERQIQLAEEQGKLIATVIRDILWDKDLDLTAAQRSASGEVVRKHLMALDSASESRSLPELATG